ncbi:MAG: ABC transporter permease [Candidatus Micrarchaeia archaeon]
MLPDLLALSYRSLSRRRLRSWLTILGIVIGIAAIIVLISIAQGLDAAIRNALNIYGTNYIIIYPSTQLGAGGLTVGPPVFRGALHERDVEAIKPIGGVEAAAGAIMVPAASIEFKGETVARSIGGTDPDVYSKFILNGFEAGRMFSPGDTSSVVIGHDVAHNFFSKDVAVGNTLKINGRDFKVRGIMNKIGIGDTDTDLIIDTKAARELLGAQYERGRVFAIFAITRKDADVREVAAEINRRLLDLHKVTEEDKDFSVVTADTILETVGNITSLLSLFLGGVAAISLVVGGIGIANTMFMSVMERTREIGTLKAIGARNRDVLLLFLAESALIGLVGGALGVALGVAASFILSQFGVPTLVTLELCGLSLAFSVAVGAVSGFVPARQAALLQPVEALRYE